MLGDEKSSVIPIQQINVCTGDNTPGKMLAVLVKVVDVDMHNAGKLLISYFVTLLYEQDLGLVVI